MAVRLALTRRAAGCAEDSFATSGHVVELWSATRSEPVTSFTWGADTVNTVKFNPVEVNIMATAGDDRSIVLFDIRQSTPIRKVWWGWGGGFFSTQVAGL